MALGDPAQRAAAAQALARELGAEAVLVFVRDPVLGKLLPGLGFPQTLPGGRRWRELAEQAARDGAAQADLRVPGDGDRSGLVRAWAVDDTVLAAVKCPDPPPQERLAPALAILPLLGQLLRREMQCAGMQAQLELTQLAAGESRLIAERLSAAHFSLQQALADVAAANAQKDAFLAIVSHDLKNPMSGIKGWAQLLRKKVARGDLAPAAFAQGLEAIEAAAANATAMVDELIDLGRIGMGREIEIRPREIDLLPLLRDAVLLHQATATGHRLIFESADAGYIGSFDSTRLSRVFDNLITNAIHYSPAGGDIAITLRPVQRGPHVWAEIAVADQGLGIPDEDLPRVFERFYRGRNAAAIAGSGLGLAGARHIVEQHGGEIRVESTVGQGTTFTIRLPLAEAVAEG